MKRLARGWGPITITSHYLLVVGMNYVILVLPTTKMSWRSMHILKLDRKMANRHNCPLISYDDEKVYAVSPRDYEEMVRAILEGYSEEFLKVAMKYAVLRVPVREIC